MAYVNVVEWKTTEVCEWLKGLDNSVLPYVHSFNNHSINGQQLLNLRPEDLEQLGVIKLGHQEIILEAVEHLRHFHYELDRENLQLLAMRLSCLAHSLYNELSQQSDSKPVTTQTLSDVASIVTDVKPLVLWLGRPPFSGQLEYNDKKSELLKLALEMATCAQRDRFAEKPVEEIRATCEQIADLTDYIIQEIADPMILQPASLDLATLKKRAGDDLGFYILPSFHGIHQIAEIKFGSVAHQCGKMEEGDEIVQVNYQTVVGWERKNVLELFSESPAEILLTLKRRPRHTKVYGQIYIKPYRLPSNKKTSYTTRWQHNLPSPRPELLTIPNFTMPLPRHTPKVPTPEPVNILNTVNLLETMATDSSDSDSENEPPSSIQLYSSKPRNLVQRRATITGASPTTKHSINIEQFWKELKHEHNVTFKLRDKAASCAHGLDNVKTGVRPRTRIGIEQLSKKVQFQDKFFESDNDKKKTAQKPKPDNCPSPVSIVNIVDNNNKNVSPVDNKLDSYNDNYINNASKDTPEKNTTLTQISIKTDNVENSKVCNNRFTNNVNSNVYNSHSSEKNEVSNNISKTESNLDDKRFENVDKLINNSVRIVCNTEKPAVTGNVEERIKNIEKITQKAMKSETTISKSTNNETRKIEEVEPINVHFERRKDSPHVIVDVNTPTKDKFFDNTIGDCQSQADKQNVTADFSDNSNNNYDDRRNTTFNDVSPKQSGKECLAQQLQSMQLVDSKKPVLNSAQVKNSPRTNNYPQLNNGDSACNNVDSTGYIDMAKVEVKVKPEVKPRPARPDPPPRKYFSKPVHSFNTSPDVEIKPKISERTNIRNFELPLEVTRRDDKPTNSCAHSQKLDFEQLSLSENDAHHSSLVEPYDYVKIPDIKAKEDKSYYYEPFAEKFGNSSHFYSTLEAPKSAETAHSMDCSNNFTFSRQTSVETKPSTLEKEKGYERGVVNRAMMVARSIGLPGSSSKSFSNSPRNTRKRNIPLAQRRNITVKEIGQGDLEGWLTYRSRGAGGAWARAWFVLKGPSLYRFKKPDTPKADCLIALTGFTASQAVEVKSRKYAFKVYHTGTVFYFAAEAEDSLTIWLDAITKATIGTDANNRFSSLFSETDESDTDSKIKTNSPSTPEPKPLAEKAFGSLKKCGKKECNAKMQQVAGASLDRKYLKFLGARNQNIPVPTAQFRSYRRALPSTPNRKLEDMVSPDLQVNIAGSTFYRLSMSHSTNDVPGRTQDMGDYRRTTENSFPRSRSGRNERQEELPGFMTLEEFMLTRQEQEGQSCQVNHVQPNNESVPEVVRSNEEMKRINVNRNLCESFACSNRSLECQPKKRNQYCNKSKVCKTPDQAHSTNFYDSRPLFEVDSKENVCRREVPCGTCDERFNSSPISRNSGMEPRLPGQILNRNDGYLGSGSELSSYSGSDTYNNVKKSKKSTRNGSFNISDCVQCDQAERNWIDSLRLTSKKFVHGDDGRSKTSQHSAQSLPFDQDKARSSFDANLDKGELVQKTNKLKYFFSNKSSPKPNTLELPGETQKTLLGSPRLHRALFGEKSSPQHHQQFNHPQNPSPVDTGMYHASRSCGGYGPSRHCNENCGSVNSSSDWNSDTSNSHVPRGATRVTVNHKQTPNSRSNLPPPTLPYIPPPTMPPPDYPGLEYPPVFEPGTYSLTDASLLRSRGKSDGETYELKYP